MSPIILLYLGFFLENTISIFRILCSNVSGSSKNSNFILLGFGQIYRYCFSRVCSPRHIGRGGEKEDRPMRKGSERNTREIDIPFNRIFILRKSFERTIYLRPSGKLSRPGAGSLVSAHRPVYVTTRGSLGKRRCRRSSH